MQFRLVLPRRVAANGKNAFDVGVKQAFSKNALSYHSGSTKKNDFHGKRVRTAA